MAPISSGDATVAHWKKTAGTLTILNFPCRQLLLIAETILPQCARTHCRLSDFVTANLQRLQFAELKCFAINESQNVSVEASTDSNVDII